MSSMRIRDALRRKRWVGPAKRLEWFPLFRAMRIKVLYLSDDWRQARIFLPLNWRTRNPGGSMFGGSMAALADPIPALACNHLFPGNQLWTRNLTLDFQRAARTDLELRFTFDSTIEQEVRAELARRGRSTPVFHFAFHLTDGSICAEVENHVAIRPFS